MTSAVHYAAHAQNLEAERSVLGAVLLDERSLHGVLDVGLQDDDFYRPAHGRVFAAMRALHSAGEAIDHLTVAAHLQRNGELDDIGGPASVEELAGWVPAAGHYREYAAIVRDLAQVRRLMRATYEIQAAASAPHSGSDELIERAEQLIFQLRANTVRGRQRLLSDAVNDEVDRLAQCSQSGRAVPGLTTGIAPLDELLGGLQQGRLYVVAARPSMGKSLIALQIARHVAAVESGRVLFASIEMSDSETAQRHLAAESGVAPSRIHLGRLHEHDWPPLLKAAQASVGLPLHLLDDGDLSLPTLRAHARQVAVRHGRLELFVVDYLQLMRAEKPSGNRVEDVSAFSRGLKRLAREFNCPVIAVSQLSRAVEQRPDKRPLLSDLRDSGQVEADADCVLMLYRDDYYDPDSERPGEMDLIVRKNRQGQLGQIATRIDEQLRYSPA